jgi:hypothetical protein
MKLKKLLEQLFRGWVPVEAKMPKKWWTTDIGITIAVLIGFSFMVFILLNSSIIVLNGSSSIRWSQTYEELRCYNSLVETSDGGFAFISATSENFLLINTDESGNILWNKTFENTGDFGLGRLIEASDGGFVLCGYSFDNGYDARLAKTDSVGNLLWTRTYDADGDEEAFLIGETSDRGFALGGQATPPESGTNDFWLAKIDGSGNMLWSQTYGGPGFESLGSLVETSDGGFALAGVTGSFGTRSFWLVKTDDSGNIHWNQTYEGIHQGYLQRVVEMSDGGFSLGSSVMQFDGNVDFWFAKTDAVGNIKWEKTHNEGTNEYLQSLVITSDGGLILAGTKSEFEPEKEILVPKVLIGDGLLVRIDNSGNMIWNQTYPGTGSTQNSNFLIKTSDGGYILLGNKLSSLGSFDFPLYDAYIAKIEEDQIVQEIVFPNLLLLIILAVFVIGTLALLIISKITKRKKSRVIV